MKTSTKWMIGIAAALVLFFLLIFYSSEIYVWAMGKITTLVIWAVIFLAGFLIGRFGTHFHLVTYTTMSANLMLREVGITLFLAAVDIGAGDGFVDAIVGGGYRWVGYGVIITVVPLLIVSLIARLGMKVNYYTLMGLIAGSTTDPPALAYANSTAGNDMPAVSYATVYPVVMFLRVLTAPVSYTHLTLPTTSRV